MKAADEKMRALRMAAATNFKSMLRDNRDIMTSSRWSRVSTINCYRDHHKFNLMVDHMILLLPRNFNLILLLLYDLPWCITNCVH